MRGILILAVVLLPILGIAAFNAAVAEEPNSGVKKPLDLPAGKAGTSEEEEDAPETISFWGSELEGDAFFWCFPAYSFCGDTSVFGTIKDEIAAGVNQLSRRVKFDLVAYNDQTYVWQRRSVYATPSNKAGAIGWMDTLGTKESECLLDAGLTTIAICNATKKPNRVMIFMGGNAPACSTSGSSGSTYATQCLNEITGANVRRVPINTVYVADVYTTGQQFWRDLAAANNGSFSEVTSE